MGFVSPRFGNFNSTFMDKKQELEALKKLEQDAAFALSDVRRRIRVLEDSVKEDAMGMKVGDTVVYKTRASLSKPSMDKRGVLEGFRHSYPVVRLYNADGKLSKKTTDLYGSTERESLRKEVSHV